MGHTIPPKREIIYSKLANLKKYARTLREPYRSRFFGLIESVYPNISCIVYANTLDDEEMMIYTMLTRLEMNAENREKVLKCLSILLTR